MDLADDAPATRSLYYVTLTHSYDTLHFLANFGYRFKEIFFEHRLCVRKRSKVLVNCPCANIFGVPTRLPKEVFIQVSSFWSSYDGSHLMFAPTPIVFIYHSSMALLTERRSFLIRIAVAENCVYALMSFFLSALLGRSVDATHVFDGVTAPAK